ncbi:hypothetical protein M899_0652 [Bacteriovorax sp. BSW11_IV]|uniref:hypothetical protein n=1 Tax=Bacteriovorax sp. BSW11_IV TaxID=1353529 RepID=UPI000389F4F1|nr:hypothetical protein [Bacteriovorax sp. BSW11_IV]EQC49010.1 hypothetical protein M899_0652 [Bacteriovorax sp. BSW11_IV]
MKKRLFTLATMAILSSSMMPINAAEIDSFTHRDKLFVFDASKFINQKFNDRLYHAAVELDINSVACPTNYEEAEDVYDIVKDHISSPFIGHAIAVDFEDNLPSKNKIFTAWEESIYRDTTLWQGVSLKLKGILSTMKIDGNIVGVDKLGHFFVEGWEFFETAYLDSEKVDIMKAIQWGQKTERTYFGMLTTGVYSNADLVANFNGMRFWNALLALSPDVLTKKKPEPYLKCTNGSWKQAKKFDIEEYVDAAFDEGINCNYYDTPKIEEHVTEKIKDSFWFKSIFTRNFDFCPVKKSKCEGLSEKYGPYANEILHPECR